MTSETLVPLIRFMQSYPGPGKHAEFFGLPNDRVDLGCVEHIRNTVMSRTYNVIANGVGDICRGSNASIDVRPLYHDS